MSQRRCMGCMNITENAVCERCGYPVHFQNEPHQLPVGTMLRGQYQVGRVLGQGGFGITYLGWDTYLDVPVAIKEYYPNSLVNRESTQSLSVRFYTGTAVPGFQAGKERFLREARALAKFDSEPAIVRIMGLFPENETAYIVMEYVRGTSLQKYIKIRGGRLGLEETLRILKPVMKALDVVHGTGMVHRDISPDNIMLHPQEGAKLLDFGAVRSVDAPNADQAMPRSTEAIVKHGFAPIEQYQTRGSLGPWTDVYALCATIWYCVTGIVPADAPSRISGEGAPDWGSVPGITLRQKQALEKGSRFLPNERTASVGELMEQLYAVDAPVVKPILTEQELQEQKLREKQRIMEAQRVWEEEQRLEKERVLEAQRVWEEEQRLEKERVMEAQRIWEEEQRLEKERVLEAQRIWEEQQRREAEANGGKKRSKSLFRWSE